VADEEQRLTDDQRELVAIGGELGADASPVWPPPQAGRRPCVTERLLAGVTKRGAGPRPIRRSGLTDHVRLSSGAR